MRFTFSDLETHLEHGNILVVCEQREWLCFVDLSSENPNVSGGWTRYPFLSLFKYCPGDG